MNQPTNPIARLSSWLALLLVFWSCVLNAQVPRTLNYQGYLTNPSGAAINNPALSLMFKLYSVASGGTALYSETQSVIVSNGIFNALIGSSTPLNLSFDQPYFVGITIAGEPTEMAPRQPLAASPYAVRSVITESLAPAATVSATQITGTISTTQIANNAITQAKLSPVAGSIAGKVLGSDGVNLRWQDVGAAGGGVEVVKWTALVVGVNDTVSSTIIPAGSVLQGVSATATFANYAAACKSVDLYVAPHYLARWLGVNPATPSVSANSSLGQSVAVPFDMPFRAFGLRCYDSASNQIPLAPGMTATVNITVSWTYPPRVIN
jgi:hypothetical protein